MATSVRIYHIDDTAANIDAGKRGKMSFYDQTKALMGYYTASNAYKYALTLDANYDGPLAIGNITVKSGAWYGLGASGGRWVFTTGDYIDLEGGELRLNGNTVYLDADNDTYYDLGTDDTVDLKIAGTRVYRISPSWATWWTRDSAGDTKNSLAYNVGEQDAGTGTFTGGTATENVIRHVADSGTLTDEGILNIVDEGGTANTQLCGYGWAVMANDTGDIVDVYFRFADGTVTIIDGNANFVTTDTDGKACILGTDAVENGNSTIIQLKNRIWETFDISYTVWYSQVGTPSF